MIADGKSSGGPDPTDDPALCTCANLRKAARAVTQAFDAALQGSGLKATQFTLLIAVARLEEAPLSRLAEALVMDRTTLTRNLKPLLSSGLIRVRSGEDRRVRMVTLTGRGRRMLEQALPLWQDAQSRIVEGLGRQRWAKLIDDLAATVALTRKG